MITPNPYGEINQFIGQFSSKVASTQFNPFARVFLACFLQFSSGWGLQTDWTDCWQLCASGRQVQPVHSRKATTGLCLCMCAFWSNPFSNTSTPAFMFANFTELERTRIFSICPDNAVVPCLILSLRLVNTTEYQSCRLYGVCDKPPTWGSG